MLFYKLQSKGEAMLLNETKFAVITVVITTRTIHAAISSQIGIFPLDVNLNVCNLLIYMS